MTQHRLEVFIRTQLNIRRIVSTLELDLKDDKIIRMTEHWNKPVKLRGDKKNVLGKMFRKRLGGLLGR